MDEHIRRQMQAAAADLAEGDAHGAVGRAMRRAARRRAGTVLTALTLMAVTTAGVVRLSADHSPSGSIIGPAGPGDTVSLPDPDADGGSVVLPERSPTRVARPGPGKATPEPADTPTPSTRPSRAPSECPEVGEPAQPPRGVSVRIALAKSRYLPGEPVKIDITVRNHGTTPVAYEHGAQEFELWVSNRNGTAWVYSHNLVFTQEMRSSTLAPGEERTRTAVWDQSTCGGPAVQPGAYSVGGAWSAWDKDAGGRGWTAEPVGLEIAE